MKIKEKQGNVVSNFSMSMGSSLFVMISFFNFFVLSGSNACAQEYRTVKGIVTIYSSGESLPGATVVVRENTSIGTITGSNGVYSLDIPLDAKQLVVTFVGMEPVTIDISGSTVDVAMKISRQVVDEVVAIGYGVIKKADVTSSVAQVTSEDFVTGAVNDAAQLIQGKVAGLTITIPSGDPTEGAVIQLRGNTSLLGTSDPLVLVDGVPGDLSTVAPEDIESIDVLKDGSAAAIYGTRGTNGVVIITTKSGKTNMAPSIEYTGYVTMSQIRRKLDFMSAGDLRSKWDEGYTFIGSNDQDYGASTDWLDEITRTPISHVHNVLFRGGNEKTSMSASLNYKDAQGIFIRSDNEKYTGRVSVNHNMFDGKLKTSIETLISERKYWTGGDGYSFNGYVYRQALIRNPTEPIRNDDGSWRERDVYVYDNPVAYIKESDGENKFKRTRLIASVTYSPVKGLDLKGLYARRGYQSIRGFYQTSKHVSTTKYGSDGYASRGTNNYQGNYFELTGNFKKEANSHSFSFLAGYNYEDAMREGFWQSNKYFPTDSYSYNNIGIGDALAKGEATMGSEKNTNTLIALFARATYSFKDKYLLMASLRREGSSRFGADSKWGYFPSASVGWRIKEEPFVENLDWINSLKLRVGFGVTGTDALSSYQSLTSYDYGDYFAYDGDWIRELIPIRNPNPDLRWERKEEYNVGVDYKLFDGKITGAFDYYTRFTKDALYNYSVPSPPYLYTTITANAAEINNSGFEALVNITPMQTETFMWNATMTFSTNSNKLVSLSNDKFQSTNDFFFDGHTGEPIQWDTHIVKVGESIGNFYGLKSVDISENGVFIVEKPDGTCIEATESSTDDRQVLGNGVPKYFASWNNSFTYKNWDLNINMRGAFEYQILNTPRMYYENPTIQYNTLNTAFNKVYGKAILNDQQRYVSYYIEDGDYWKIDNITLGYTLSIRNSSVFSKVRIYASGLNLFVLTGYKGIDPEVSQIGLSPGIDNRDSYPTTRSYTLGVNVTF